MNILVVELKYELCERKERCLGFWVGHLGGAHNGDGKNLRGKHTLFKKGVEVRPGNLGTRFWAAKYELCIGTSKGRCQVKIRGKIWAEKCVLET